MGAIYVLMILAVDALIAFYSARLLGADDVSTQRKCMKGIYIGATLVVLAFLIGQVTI